MSYTHIFHSHGPDFINAIRTLLAASEKAHVDALRAHEVFTRWGAEPTEEEWCIIEAANDAARDAEAALHAAWRDAGLFDRPTWEIAWAVTP